MYEGDIRQYGLGTHDVMKRFVSHYCYPGGADFKVCRFKISTFNCQSQFSSHNNGSSDAMKKKYIFTMNSQWRRLYKAEITRHRCNIWC